MPTNPTPPDVPSGFWVGVAALLSLIGTALTGYFGLRKKRTEATTAEQSHKDDRAFETQADLLDDIRVDNRELREQLAKTREYYEQALAQLRVDRDKALDDRTAARQAAADYARRVVLLEEQIRSLGEEPRNGKTHD